MKISFFEIGCGVAAFLACVAFECRAENPSFECNSKTGECQRILTHGMCNAMPDGHKQNCKRSVSEQLKNAAEINDARTVQNRETLVPAIEPMLVPKSTQKARDNTAKGILISELNSELKTLQMAKSVNDKKWQVVTQRNISALQRELKFR